MDIQTDIYTILYLIYINYIYTSTVICAVKLKLLIAAYITYYLYICFL